MHEFSIATSIVEAALSCAKKNNAKKIASLELEVGEMAGVIFEALDFAMQSAVKDTILEEAEIIVHKISAIAKCNACGNEFPVENFYDNCPLCAEFNPEIIKGKELKIKSMYVD